jgi:hypothetical protein
MIKTIRRRKAYDRMVKLLINALHSYILGDAEGVKRWMNEATLQFKDWTEI